MSRLRRRHGYIMMELILSVLIVLMLVPVILLSISSLSTSLSFEQTVQDEIAIQQLRRILALSYDLEVEGNGLTFRYQGKQRNLCFVNQKLVIQPGTWIFLTELDDLAILESSELVYLSYVRNGENYVSPLKKK